MNEELGCHNPLAEREVTRGVPSIDELTLSWGDPHRVSSYLGRCQVDTPLDIVQSTWEHVQKLRPWKLGKVIDLGAGDGRFAHHGNYTSYIGYEIDPHRCSGARLPANARLVNQCAFTDLEPDADVCIGNPPFVRNQDIPAKWREHVHGVVLQGTSVRVSGLANAWQYFFLHSLARLKADGLAALVVPFEWVSRPSAVPLRKYIREQQWDVHVYRLRGSRFQSVLTTASITVVDRASRSGEWEFHDETADGRTLRMTSPTGSTAGVLGYLPAKDIPAERPRAKRGLSPGTQGALVLTEEQRKKHSLQINRDVAACVTSLRPLSPVVNELDQTGFREHYIEGGRRCWLIRTNRGPSSELRAYLSSVPDGERQTRTCLSRPEWWRFAMPGTPSMLFAQGFREKFPKIVRNSVGAHAVGGVCGIYDASDMQVDELTDKLGGMDLRDHVVSYSSGFYKVEINQINELLANLTTNGDG